MKGMTPAALVAAAAGDAHNAAIAMIPGGIEAQEAAGQQAMIACSMIPKDIRGATRVDLEGLGFKFGGDVDELFVSVELPAGWKLQATPHSMHSDLLDERGRKRAGIFYKAAFYDRRATLHIARRFTINCYRPCDSDGNDQADSGSTHNAVEIQDAGAVVHIVGLYLDRDYDRCAQLDALAKTWLDEHHPDWQDPLALWDAAP